MQEGLGWYAGALTCVGMEANLLAEFGATVRLEEHVHFLFIWLQALLPLGRGSGKC